MEAVSEALPEQEHLNEGCEGFITQEGFRKSYSLLVQFLSGKGRVVVHLFQVFGNGAVGVMFEGVLQDAGITFNHDLFMYLALFNGAGPFFEESQGVVGPPAAVADPFAEEEILAGHVIALVIGTRYGFFNLCLQACRHPLVSIEDQYPRQSGLVNSSLFLPCVTLPCNLENLVSICSGKL